MPASAPIDLLTAVGISADGAGVEQSGLGRYAGVYLLLDCTGAPSGGTPTLDVYVQASVDGVRWQDVAAYRFTAIATRYVQLSQIAAGGTASRAPSDGALTNDTVVQGPFGDRLRVKYKFAQGGSTGAFALSVKGVPLAGV